MKNIIDTYKNYNPGFVKNARVFSLFLFSLIIPAQLVAQQFRELRVSGIIELDVRLEEVSGITFVGDRVFAINDSGNSRDVHLLDIESFDLLASIKVEGTKNVDWEEISVFNETLYIGDFGNNFGSRKDLGIYKVDIDSLMLSDSEAEKIKFKYSSQNSYYKADYKNHIYDCEAMVVDESGMWLFSKDWIDRTTRLYKVESNAEKKQSIRPLDSLNLGYLVTGAYYDKTFDKLFLCGYEGKDTYLSIFSTQGEVSIKGKRVTYLIPEIKYGQVESVFVKDNVVYLASERTVRRPLIYMINISGIGE